MGFQPDRSKNRSKRRASSTRIDCPWDTIRMVPTPTVAGDQTSLDSQLNHEHPVYQKPELVPEEIRGFLSKPPKTPSCSNSSAKTTPSFRGR